MSEICMGGLCHLQVCFYFASHLDALKRLHLARLTLQADLWHSNCTFLSKWPMKRRHQVMLMCGSQSILPKPIKPLMTWDFITFHPPTNLLSAVKTPSFKHRTGEIPRDISRQRLWYSAKVTAMNLYHFFPRGSNANSALHALSSVPAKVTPGLVKTPPTPKMYHLA